MWLTKQHTCPTCRAPLPERDARAARRDADEAGEGGGPTLRDWSDYAVPRGTAPLPSSGMYT